MEWDGRMCCTHLKYVIWVSKRPGQSSLLSLLEKLAFEQSFAPESLNRHTNRESHLGPFDVHAATSQYTFLSQLSLQVNCEEGIEYLEGSCSLKCWCSHVSVEISCVTICWSQNPIHVICTFGHSYISHLGAVWDIKLEAESPWLS